MGHVDWTEQDNKNLIRNDAEIEKRLDDAQSTENPQKNQRIMHESTLEDTEQIRDLRHAAMDSATSMKQARTRFVCSAFAGRQSHGKPKHGPWERHCPHNSTAT